MPKTYLKHIVFVGVIFLMGIMTNCSQEKDALLNIGYHNMTARYNGYFNARVLMEEAMSSYRQTVKEDYTKILPLEVYPSQEDVSEIQAPFDEAQEKCEKVILRHSMPPAKDGKNKSVEHCRWIDDNWFLIGQIHFTKRDYMKAEEIFKFISEAEMYKDQERVHEARLWLAKTYIKQNRFPEAKRLLSKSETEINDAEAKEKAKKEKLSKYEKKIRRRQKKRNKEKNVKKPAPFPDDLRDDYQITMAQYYIAQKNYKKAVPHLEQAIQLTKKRKRKARYMFVLAQILQEIGDGERAAYYFEKVAKSNAPYEMRFQAKINKALSLPTGGESIRQELTKMLKDDKNLEYKDQIYYALAELEMKSGNKQKAIFYYTRSAFNSINNDRQKGISYLKLGDIYFKDKDYLKAQKYYDSTVQVLPEEYPRYKQIEGKAEGLSDLVAHYETYVYEDSVQRIVQMPEKEREKFLKKTLKDIKEEEARKKAEEERKLLAQQERMKKLSSNSGTGSKWYFYNQKISSSGFNDFRANWGQRKLEDDWRRSTKTSYTTDENGNLEGSDSLAEETDSLTVESLRERLPLSETALDSSQNRLMNSLYMLGIIYKEQLKEPGEAIKYFSKIPERNIEHPKVLPALYQLHLLHKKGSASKAEDYKQQILSEYPNSEIAQILKDPEFLKKKQEKEKEDLNTYSAILEDYRYHRYNKVLSASNQIIANDSTNQYLYKYYLLKAFTIAKTRPGNINAIKEPLQKLYTMAPKSEEGEQAKKYLDKLEKGINIVKPDDSSEKEENKSPYIFDENLEHYFVLIFPKEKGKINATKIKLSNFNSDFFRKERLQITLAQLGTDNQLLVVRKFPNLEKAKNYSLSFNSTAARPTLGKMAEEFETFLINAKNLPKLFETTDLSNYLDFYKDQYPQ